MKQVHGWWLPDDEIHIGHYLDATNSDIYQPNHQHESVKRCSQFRTALDIGAHVGLWARGLTEKFETVIAFEPCDEFSQLLEHNAPKVKTIHRVALGDKEGSVKMVIAPDNTGSTHVERGADGVTPMLPLDHFQLTDVDFVKIDVEGFELEVIRGGFDTFKNNSPVVIVEQKDRYAIPEQGNHAAVRFLMRELRYRLIGKVIDDWILKKL